MGGQLKSLFWSLNEDIQSRPLVELSHVPRDSNICADWLARHSLFCSFDSGINSHIPLGLLRLLYADNLGFSPSINNNPFSTAHVLVQPS